MKKIVRLTERDLTRIVKRVLQEQSTPSKCEDNLKTALGNDYEKVKTVCIPNPLDTKCLSLLKTMPTAAKKALDEYQKCKMIKY